MFQADDGLGARRSPGQVRFECRLQWRAPGIELARAMQQLHDEGVVDVAANGEAATLARGIEPGHFGIRRPSRGATDHDLVSEPAKVFDNLYFVGQTEYSAWAVTTSDGIIIIDTIFDYSVEDEVVGGLKTLGLLYDSASDSSRATAESIKALGQKMGFTVVEAAAMGLNNVASAAHDAEGLVGVLDEVTKAVGETRNAAGQVLEASETVEGAASRLQRGIEGFPGRVAV